MARREIMNCPNCGLPIADGSSFCVGCGAPVAQQPQQNQQPQMQYQQPQYQQPQFEQPQMQYQQPQQQYQQPQQAFQPQQQSFQQSSQKVGLPGNGSFIEVMKADPVRICAYVGYMFTFLASFVPRWVSVSFFGVTQGAGLFASDGGILKLWGILFLLGSIVGCLMEFGSFIPAINNVAAKVKALPYSQFYIPGLFVILYILCRFNGNFTTFVNAGGSWGFAKWICLIGILLLLVRPILKLVKKEEYWD